MKKWGAEFGIRITLVLVLLVSLQACVTNDLTPMKAQAAAQYNAELGANYLQRGDLDQARDKLEKALEQDSNNALAHVTYAQLQHRIDQTDRALLHFNKAIELEPEQADHRNSFGVFLCQTGQYKEAEKQFGVAANNPYYRTPEYAFDNSGLCLLEAGRLDEAEGKLRKALKTNPKFANAYLHMAELLLKRERLTVADAYFERYQTLGSDTAESLYLGMQIKRKAGDLVVAERYASRLLNEFPASRQAGAYLTKPLN